MGSWDFIEIGHDDAQPFLENWYSGEKGCKYDFIGLLRCVCRFITPSGVRWWCSEVVDAACDIAGLHSVSRWMASPNDLDCGQTKMTWVPEGYSVLPSQDF